MGNNTEFYGQLSFTKELTGGQLAKLTKILKEDLKKHREWNKYIDKNVYLNSIDISLTEDFSGLEWNGAEKTYLMHEQINFIIKYMKAEVDSEFGLKGIMEAQDFYFMYEIVIREDGLAELVENKLAKLKTSDRIRCPCCNEEYSIRDAVVVEVIE